MQIERGVAQETGLSQLGHQILTRPSDRHIVVVLVAAGVVGGVVTGTEVEVEGFMTTGIATDTDPVLGHAPRRGDSVTGMIVIESLDSSTMTAVHGTLAMTEMSVNVKSVPRSKEPLTSLHHLQEMCLRLPSPQLRRHSGLCQTGRRLYLTLALPLAKSLQLVLVP
jgi:hypothetical protein